MSNSKIPIIVGPTGVGKSEVAYQLALRLDAEILSADAFQVYSGMEIGTAQAPKEWQKKVPHHLTGIRKPGENWNAVEFAREAKKIIEAQTIKNKQLLIVGGAGFYLRALVSGPPEGEAPSHETREEIQTKVKELGNQKAHDWLKERDPQAAKRIHVNDTMRIGRALEKSFLAPAPQNQVSKAKDYEPLGEMNVQFIGLERSRENLDHKLKSRTEAMWKGGLLEETQELLDSKLSTADPFWGAIGYAEAAAFIKKEMTQAEALEKIFRRSRQYAKRQWTWFKHQHEVKWFNLDEFPNISSIVKEVEKQITH